MGFLQPKTLPVGQPSASVSLVSQPQPPNNDILIDLQATIAGLLKRLEILESEKNQLPAEPSPVVAANPVQVATKAVFQTQDLYLGSASTIARDWTETGATINLNAANYPNDVKAVFEAGLSIIGGEAWARLINTSTGAIISVTEIFHNNNIVTWKTSPVFKLHPGNNAYTVQIKSTSGETANLNGCRIKLFQ